MNTLFTRLLVASALSCAALTNAHAAWPEKSVAVVVPWAPGGSTDILARMLSENLTRSLGQTFIVENKPGASGNIGSNTVAKAKPDGYTLLVGSMSTHAMNGALFSKMPFHPVDDFTPIALIALVTNTMVTNSAVPARTVAELIAYAKANPGKLNYASAGVGSTNHISAAMFEKAAGVTMNHVPYKGGAPAVLDTVSGQTQVLFSAGTQTLPHVKTGKLNLIAVTEDKRATLLPNTPTVAETLPGYELVVWYGVFGPKNMPADITNKLSAEINKTLAQPAVIDRMRAIGVELVQSTPEGFAKTLQADTARYTKLIKELNISAE